MTMQKWVVVADGNLARIYTQDINSHKEPLKLLHTLEHPESKKRDSELVSDRPGHYQSRGTSHGAYVPRSDPKENEIDRFAQEIANHLDQGRVQNQFEQLFIFAEPHFYGLMGMHLNKYLKDMVKKVVQKDYMHLNETELRDEINKK